MTRYQILLFLLENSPCNQMAVQERLKIDQAALTRHFKILERKVWWSVIVILKSSGSVGRGYEVCEGAVSDEPPLQHIKVKEAMENILTESERTELSRLLNKLVLGIENIEI